MFLLVLTYAILGHHTRLRDLSNKQEFKLDDSAFYTLSILLLLTNVDSFENICEGKYSDSFFQKKQKYGIKSLKSDNFKERLNSSLSFFYKYICIVKVEILIVQL